MRILFVCQTYAPSHDAVSQILTDLAEGLVALGFDIHVLTNQVNYMTGKSLPRHQTENGVRIWRVPGVAAKRVHPVMRMGVYAGFFALSGPMMALIPSPDVVVYLSTPPLLAWSAGFVDVFLKAKTVYWAQDVYPEVPVKMGYIRNRVAVKLLEAAECRISSRVDCIVTIGDLMAEKFRCKGVAADRIEVVPNWSPIKVYSEDDETLRDEMGLSEQFIVQYSGNMGVVHDMTPIIFAAKQLRDMMDIAWLMVGDGKRKAELECAVSKYGLKNVRFAPYQPLERLWSTLRCADVSIISLRPDMEGLVVPSKLYAAMEAGLPIVFIGRRDGEVARTIADAECGVTVEDGAELADVILKLKADDVWRRALGKNGALRYREKYSRKRRIADFAALLKRLGGK